MKNFTILSLLTVFFTNTYCQKVVVNQDLPVDHTTVAISSGEVYNHCVVHDRTEDERIMIRISQRGYAGYCIHFSLYKGVIIPDVSRWSDVGEFDGKSQTNVGIEEYTIELNQESYAIGDTIKAKYKIILDDGKFAKGKIITGELYHIINNNCFIWDDKKYSNDGWYKDYMERKKKID